MELLVIHGPNLNLLGTRELSVYGPSTLEDVDEALRSAASELEVKLDIHQSAHEGVIIDHLHAGIGKVEGALLNPAAFSHTSRAIADAIRAVPYPVLEVHLSNIHAREPWRAKSVTAEAARGVVAGLGPQSYVAALRGLVGLLRA
jgi:3-dehydroquinate dehydratase-2